MSFKQFLIFKWLGFFYFLEKNQIGPVQVAVLGAVIAVASVFFLGRASVNWF